MGTVREIEPRSIHAGVNKPAQVLRRVGRGSEGGDDLRATLGVHRLRVAPSSSRPGESVPARIQGACAELLFDSKQLVVLRDAVATCRRPRLDLTGPERDRE